MKIGTIKIMEEEVTVDADVNGRFWLYLERDELEGEPRQDSLGSGDTLEQAKRQARIALGKRRVEVAVPFTTLDGRRGIAIKRNLRTRGIICEIDGERSELPDSFRAVVLREDAPADVSAELTALTERIRADEQAKKALLDKWQFRLGPRLDQVILEAAEAQETEGAAA